jgi:hypothetical protein
MTEYKQSHNPFTYQKVKQSAGYRDLEGQSPISVSLHQP